MRLLDRMLDHAQSQGLLRKRGMQRTDSTHVLAAVRRLNRLQLVQETMRHVLDVLALVAPTWLQSQIDARWADRYGSPFTRGRLPKSEAVRQALAEAIGQDGFTLLAAIDAAGTPPSVAGLEAIQTLRRIWAQQYEQHDDGPRFRASSDLADAADLDCSPYDADARYSDRHEIGWVGYMLHPTDTCEPDLPSLVVQVETTPATTPDFTTLPVIQEDFAVRNRRPGTQVADSGYLTADAVVRSRTQRITLVGPMQPDSSWQARSGQGYAQPTFQLEWEQQATCPQGKTSSTWRSVTRRGNPAIQIHFRMADCQACPVWEQCTQADRRSLTIAERAVHEARIQARAAETSSTFRTTYQRRAGIEGTLSVAVPIWGGIGRGAVRGAHIMAERRGGTDDRRA